MSSYLGFTFHRKLRRLARNIKLWRRWLSNYLNRHVFGSWQKLGKMKWTFASWILIVFVSLWGLIVQINSLGGIAQKEEPKSGGVYREALVGEVKGVNPLFPDNSASLDVSSIVFSGLTKLNGEREVVPDVAERWEVTPDRKNYTFYIRENAKWQDGVSLTAKDVAFTIDTVQNPDTRSPLYQNWNGVKYEILNDRAIKLSIPSSYGNFLANTTIGLLPKHKLENVPASSLKSYEFNQQPVGSGPYKVGLIKADSSLIELEANQLYYIRSPYIKKIEFLLYPDQAKALEGLIKRQVNGLGQVLAQDVDTAEKIKGVNLYKLGLPAYVGAFFNLKNQTLQNSELRKALAYSVDRNKIINESLEGQGVASYYPIPAGFAGFNPSATKYLYDKQKAKDITDKIKDVPRLRLVTLDNETYKSIAEKLASDWNDIGIKTEIILANPTDLQQNFIRSRNYDILLFGQNIGIDSDVYSFWHSSQIDDPGLNISYYKNTNADRLLESGRLAKDPKFKSNQYAGFIDIWSKDLPAIILYNPYYNYAQSDIVKGFKAKKISEPSNRFYNIYDWYLNKTN